jgi:hypothetical protein
MEDAQQDAAFPDDPLSRARRVMERRGALSAER